METANTVLCSYKNKIMKFSERNMDFDGEYIFVANGTGDFSLYSVDAFTSFCQSLSEAGKRSDGKLVGKMARYILMRAVEVGISRGSFTVPSIEWLSINDSYFCARVYSDHIRFVSFGKYEDNKNKKDVIEMALQQLKI